MAKPKLRNLSRRELSEEDYVAVVEQLEAPDVPDMVAAILGATLVEHQIEQALRIQLKHGDASTWGRLTDPTGPLRDFSSKIALGYALGRYDEEIVENLSIVKNIRNAFAHARTLLTFDHPTVKAELGKTKPIRHGKRTLSVATLAIGVEKRAYLSLCFSIFMYFHLKLVQSVKRRERHLEAKREELRFLEEFIASMKAAKQSRSGGRTA
ncbi:MULTISPECIES: hypothetical protein [Bradyrhizobium]|uniref:hypothetical protein n=1 Tax=Bradyrhizobium TaxID=374 RepID=UPI0004878DAC|nr:MULTISPECIES: hypothetical protein [Bradyrhizobium]QOG22244.1 hypothetical protein FOM02_38105 [Bradyrhizobium sp. SEMIA]UFW50016.1 hypothetical protein BaraCB756_02710 [Bradyrhizobium arachidis]